MKSTGAAVARIAAAKNRGEEPRLFNRFTAGLEESRGAPQGQAMPSGLFLPHLGQIIRDPPSVKI